MAQGYDYYLRFIERFPTPATLAAATQDDVMSAWQGLGYYSRARNMHAAAQSIVSQGGFPVTYAGVRALKGVGDYTAAAICSFAYGMPHAVVDGNVYRVLARFFGIDAPIDTTAGKKLFATLAEELLDKEHPACYNQAIMDFGALQCVPRNPQCSSCPLQPACAAAAHGDVDRLPAKAKRTQITVRHLVYVFTEDGEQTYLHRRPPGDIWQGLYEPPLFEFAATPSEEEACAAITKHFGTFLQSMSSVRHGIKHVLTHRRLLVDFYRAHVSKDFRYADFKAVPLEETDNYPVPRLVSDLLKIVQ